MTEVNQFYAGANTQSKDGGRGSARAASWKSISPKEDGAPEACPPVIAFRIEGEAQWRARLRPSRFW